MGRRKRLSQKNILDELVAIGFARATDYLFADGDKLSIKPTEALSRREAAAIASIERTSTGLKVKFYDKMKALELLGRQLGMFDGGGNQPIEENNLLQALLDITKEEIATDDIQELQQTAENRPDLVESPRS